MDNAKAEVAKEKLAICASNIIEGCSAENSFQSDSNSNVNSCWDAILSDSDEFDSVDQDTTSNGRDTINAKVKKQILLYFADKRINREVDPLWYWRMNLSLYPMLSIHF